MFAAFRETIEAKRCNGRIELVCEESTPVWCGMSHESTLLIDTANLGQKRPPYSAKDALIVFPKFTSAILLAVWPRSKNTAGRLPRHWLLSVR